MEGGDSQQVWVEWILGLQLLNSTYGVLPWRTIRNLWPDLSRNIVYKVGMGRKNLFWKENWNGNEALMVLFPDLFS